MDRRRLPTVVFSTVCVMVLCGSRSNCDTRTGGLTCANVAVTVQPGTCVAISNPCGPQWALQDGFKLCDEPAGLTINTVRSRGAVTREICASASTPVLASEPVGFLYSTTDDFGEGLFSVTVGVPVSVVASASPTSVTPGNNSQLDAIATGGTGSYSYSWSPAGSLSNPTLQNPMAFPVTTTTYVVTVTDSGGNVATASVQVTVAAALTVTANPLTLNAGQTTQLNVSLSGAVPPITYSWVPTPDGGPFSMSSRTVANPQGAPSTTTTYTVTVTDQNGTYTGSVVVTVNMNAFVFANPTTITAGGTSQLSVSPSGGTPPYTYAWSPAASLSDHTISNPVASPLATTTYSVTVTDLLGQSVSRSVTVTVGGSVLTACFTTNPNPPTVFNFFTIDMSCSTGAVTTYRLWLNYFPGATPTYVGSQPTYTTIVEAPLTFNTRVEVDDGMGGTAIFEAPIVVTP